MESLNFIEILGYLSSIMVAISLMMKDIVRLRVLNFIGCALFSTYGVLIEAWPVAGMNAFVACINIYYLVKMYRERNMQTAVA